MKPIEIATWNPARGVWETSQRQLCGHLDAYWQTWPTSGLMRAGTAYEQPTWERRMADSESSSSPLLPTARATDGTNGGPNQRGSSGDMMLPSAVLLLPTPEAATNGNTPESHLSRKPGRKKVTNLEVLVNGGPLPG